MLTTMYGLVTGSASLLLVTLARLSFSAPLARRTRSRSSTLSLNTIRLTSRSWRTSAVRAKSAVLAAMSSSTAPISPQARMPPLRKNLGTPKPASSERSVEVDCYPGMEVRCDGAQIGRAYPHRTRQHIRGIIERTDARQRIDNRSAIEDDGRGTEGTGERAVPGREAAIGEHPPRNRPRVGLAEHPFHGALPTRRGDVHGVGRHADALLGTDRDRHLAQQCTIALQVHHATVERHREVQRLVEVRLSLEQLDHDLEPVLV